MSSTTQDTPANPADMASARRTLIMVALIVSTVLAALDSSFVPIAAADMIDKLQTSTSRVVWVALGYLIAATGPMLFFSRMGETHGHIRLFQIGTVLYSVCMSLCAWAPDIFTLVLLRIFQGVGMALFLPATFAIAAQIYPANQRGKALGILQMANALGFVGGPVFAGYLLDAFDWTAIFWARIPFAALAVAIALLVFGFKSALVPLKKREHMDVAGAVLLTLGFFGVLFGLNRLPVEDNHLDLTIWLVLIAGFIIFILFYRQEQKSPDPLVDFNLFRQSRQFTMASIAFAALFASFPVHLFIYPLVLQAGLEIRAWDVGLYMCASALVTASLSPFIGGWADKFGPEKFCFAGAIICVIGYLSMLLIDMNSGWFQFILPMVLIGAGTGLFFSPNNAMIINSVPPEQASLASGLIGTLRQSGYAVGYALIASLFTAVQDLYEAELAYFSVGVLPETLPEDPAELFELGGIWSPEILIYVFQITIIICTAILILVLINSIPKLRLQGAQHMGAVALTLIAGFFGTAAFVGASELTPSGSTGETARSNWRVFEQPQAFGWSSRSVEVQTRDVASLDGGIYFVDYCSACHGEDARGAEGLGVDLVTSQFVAGLDDAGMREFLIAGREEAAPDSVTGELMPAFDWLEEDELTGIVEYLRGINNP